MTRGGQDIGRDGHPRSDASRLWLVVAGMAFTLGVAFLGVVSPAHHQNVESGRHSRLIQITSSDLPSLVAPGALDRKGERLIFWSSGDLVGRNPDRFGEIYSLEIASLQITQVTESPGLSAYSAPVISGDGSRAFFISSLSGAILCFEFASGELENPPGLEGQWRGAEVAAVSDSGDRLLLQTGPTDFTLTGVTGRVLATIHNAHAPVIDGAGEVIVYIRSYPIEQRNWLVRYSVPDSREEPVFTTFDGWDPPIRFTGPSLSRNARFATFVSNLRPQPDGPEQFARIWVFDFETGKRSAFETTEDVYVMSPRISGSGSAVAFYASNHFPGDRPLTTPGLAIFWRDLQTGETLEIGGGAGCDSVPGLNLSDDGRTMAFATNCLGGPAEEVFLALVE